MSEADWLNESLIRRLAHPRSESDEPSERKLRLFAVACCYRAAEWVGPLEFRELIEACEQAADDPTPPRIRTLAQLASQVEQLLRAAAPDDASRHATTYLIDELVRDSPSAAWAASYCRDLMFGDDEGWSGFHGEEYFQADLYRDIFGNPFRPVAFDPTWRTRTVEAIAAGVYADRAFDRLPVLADALEDAGCDAADLLAHLRGPGPHVRGCWALDLVLGKD